MAFWSKTKEESLASALTGGDLHRVKTLLGEGVKPQEMLSQMPDILERAARKRALSTVCGFLEVALGSGVSAKHPSIQRMEIAVTSKDSGWWPLYHGSEYILSWVEKLVKSGITLEARSEGGMGFLHRLCEPYVTVADSTFNDKELATFLSVARMLPGNLAQRLNEKDDLGKTPLHYAVSFREGKATTGFVVGWMIRNGADVTAADNSGVTPLEIMKTRHDTLLPLLAKEETGQRAVGVTGADLVENGWIVASRDSVAYVENMPMLSYKLTEVFNFEKGEKVTLTQNLATRQELRETHLFKDLAGSDSLKKAFDFYRASGGRSMLELPKPGVEKTPREMEL